MITIEKMRQAGKCLNNVTWTDEELGISIKGTELALVFLEAAGEKWSLAAKPLRAQLELLMGFKGARKEIDYKTMRWSKSR